MMLSAPLVSGRLPLSRLVKVSVVAPSHEAEELVRELYEFEWFHAEESRGGASRGLQEAYEKVRDLRVELDSLIAEMGIHEEQGLIDQLIHGYKVQREELEAREVEELAEKLLGEAESIISQVRTLDEEIERERRKAAELRRLLSAIQLLKDLEIDLTLLKRLKRFYAVFTVVARRDLDEIRRSLPRAGILEVDIGNGLAALLIVVRREEDYRVNRVLHGFGVKPFEIPATFPQKPAEAYTAISELLEKSEEKLAEAELSMKRVREESGDRLLTLREAASILEEILHRLGVPGGLKRFRIVTGFIPEEKREEFEEKFCSRYGVYFEEPSHGSKPPALMKNRSFIREFEKITEIQGYPNYGEIDPTPFVALFFSIFYGIMFADLGQGLVLALFGYFMYRRVVGGLREWAKLLMALGAASAVSGLLLGEFFGFHLTEIVGTPSVLHLLADHQFEMSEVLKLMQFTFLMGMIHLTLGYSLAFIKDLRMGEKVEAYSSRLPTITMYFFGILFTLCFIGSGDMTAIFTSSNLVPFIGVPVKTLAPIAVGGVLASMFTIMFGRGVAAILGKIKGSIIGLIGGGILEVLENIIHFMSNTLSYVRLTVLLLVHVALLMILNMTWDALGLASIPILIIGNLGIMALEGLIVFIQALRLHLYEFFTKFYEGEGKPFRKIKSEGKRVVLRFR